ncbi:unnamed protein product [Oikopleura dioica]|uniref:Uncharacterized protein n=1 Tax=Oikopleura dioica TaxID=34765 RepID=E4YQA0_OIKDI|nr:unnamed protein product [Oikopleura dioica]
MEHQISVSRIKVDKSSKLKPKAQFSKLKTTNKWIRFALPAAVKKTAQDASIAQLAVIPANARWKSARKFAKVAKIALPDASRANAQNAPPRNAKAIAARPAKRNKIRFQLWKQPFNV